MLEGLVGRNEGRELDEGRINRFGGDGREREHQEPTQNELLGKVKLLSGVRSDLEANRGYKNEEFETERPIKKGGRGGRSRGNKV